MDRGQLKWIVFTTLLHCYPGQLHCPEDLPAGSSAVITCSSTGATDVFFMTPGRVTAAACISDKLTCLSHDGRYTGTMVNQTYSSLEIQQLQRSDEGVWNCVDIHGRMKTTNCTLTIKKVLLHPASISIGVVVGVVVAASVVFLVVAAIIIYCCIQKRLKTKSAQLPAMTPNPVYFESDTDLYQPFESRERRADTDLSLNSVYGRDNLTADIDDIETSFTTRAPTDVDSCHTYSTFGRDKPHSGKGGFEPSDKPTEQGTEASSSYLYRNGGSGNVDLNTRGSFNSESNPTTLSASSPNPRRFKSEITTTDDNMANTSSQYVGSGPSCSDVDGALESTKQHLSTEDSEVNNAISTGQEGETSSSNMYSTFGSDKPTSVEETDEGNNSKWKNPIEYNTFGKYQTLYI